MAVNLISSTTINRITAYQGQPGTSNSTLYTVPASTTVKLALIITNTTSTSATVTLSVVPSAGTAGVTNRVMSAYPVAANGIVTLDSPIYMNAGDFLAGLQGTSGALTVTASAETYA